MARDTSRDGFGNELQTYVLTHFGGLWRLLQRSRPLSRAINKTLINSAIYKIPTRPFAFSLMNLDKLVPGTQRAKSTDTYTSWESLVDRTYTGRHLPPDPAFTAKLPDVDAVANLFRKRNGATIYSEKSTLLFPYFVQWFTDGFLRTAGDNRLKNTSNHHIDLSPVYGLTPRSTDMLRSFAGGKLKSQTINGEEYPEFFYDPVSGAVKPEFAGLYTPLNDEARLPLEQRARFFAMGVERANVQIGYVMLNVLCLREHNRLCDVLARAYPSWDDERLFQTARNILIVLILKVVVEEYINHIAPYEFKFIADPFSFPNERWYRQNWMAVEFTLVYRWHSALPPTATYAGQTMPMWDTFGNNALVMQHGLGVMFEETSAQAAGRIGLHNTDDMLVDAAEKRGIQLGREAQVASYNDYRAMCGFPRVTKFSQITGDADTQRELEQLYGSVDNIELYTGLYAEDVRENSALPALVGRIVGIDAFSQALTNPLLAPSIFNEATFSPVGWEIVNAPVTLGDLVNRNTPPPPQKKKWNVTFYRKGLSAGA
ncbi:MAG TPA: peroxidase family protein [Xanthomonadales bacterium]|nr:peroxidase family protein [Xanthomonadales bacterium]